MLLVVEMFAAYIDICVKRYLSFSVFLLPYLDGLQS